MQETDFDGKRGEVLAVPTGGQLGARAALLLGVGDEATFDAAALRRAGATLAKRASRVASVATTLLDAVGSEIDPALAAQAFAEGVCLGRYQFLRYKSEAKPSRLERVFVVGDRQQRQEREGARRHRARRADRGSGRVGARPDQRARGGEVAGRRGRSGRASSPARRG